MIHGNYVICDTPDKLPNLSGAIKIYSDVETTAFRRDIFGNKAYSGHRACGVGITVDDSTIGWYLPLRHVVPLGKQMGMYNPVPKNIDLEVARRFFQDLFGDPNRRWINHNLKFDARMIGVEGVDIRCKFRCTLSLAKVVDLQKKLSGYGQKQLIREWCGWDTDKQDEVKAELRRLETKDYAELPVDLCGEYCVEDTFQARELHCEIHRRKYEGADRIFRMEDDLAEELYHSEKVGVLVDRDAMDAADEAKSEEAERLGDEIRAAGVTIDIGSPKEVAKLLYDDWNLPVVKRTDSKAPSTDADALKMLSELPAVQGTEREPLFKKIRACREAHQFMSFYTKGWLEHIGHDGRLHPEFNQVVRTGRMSCRNPNAQQLNKEAKRLIVPEPGYAFLSRDYSQIEYRLIVSRANITSAIDQYNSDPRTDFHQFVADLCQINRSPEAKGVNFGISFGMGEEGLLKQLARSMRGEDAAERAKMVYDTYQRMFPEIKKCSDYAKKLARTRAGYVDGEYGYIDTMFGRRRALRYWKYREGHQGDAFHDETRKAFNSTIQGTAADIIKDRFIACCRDPFLRSVSVRPLLLVHDELLFTGPREAILSLEVERAIDSIMCRIEDFTLPVPLLVSGGASDVNWALAG